MNEWFAIVCDQDIVGTNGRIEYRKGDVCSFGTSYDTDALIALGKRAVSIGQFDESGPDFSIFTWDSQTETLVKQTNANP